MGAAVLVPIIASAIAAVGSVASGVINAPKSSKPPALPKPIDTNKAAAEAEAKQRKQAAAASGQASTIITSPLGSEDNTSGQSTLLGQ